jgi:hypothetical protein
MFEKTYQLKNIQIKRIAVKGISFGNVGRIKCLNKYTLTRPAIKIMTPDPKIEESSLLISS